MSGVYIKGIQKPSQCGECKICNWIPIGEYDLMLKCPLLERKVGFATRREDCPLIPVPDHGDLIDRDALLDAWDDNHTIPSEAAKVIEKTIIAADREQVYFYGNPTDGMNYCPRCGNHMKQKPTSDPTSTFYDLLYEEGGANTT